MKRLIMLKQKFIQEWPLKSKLDPSIYGSPESAITDEIVEQQIKGVMSLDEVIYIISILIYMVSLRLY